MLRRKIARDGWWSSEISINSIPGIEFHPTLPLTSDFRTSMFELSCVWRTKKTAWAHCPLCLLQRANECLGPACPRGSKAIHSSIKQGRLKTKPALLIPVERTPTGPPARTEDRKYDRRNKKNDRAPPKPISSFPFPP